MRKQETLQKGCEQKMVDAEHNFINYLAIPNIGNVYKQWQSYSIQILLLLLDKKNTKR